MSSTNKLLKQAKRILTEDPDEAIELLQQALKHDSQSINGYLLLGKAYILKEDVDKATDALHRCIKIDPGNVNAWKGYYSLVRNQQDLKRFLDATNEYGQVLLSNGEGLQGLVDQVNLYMKKNGSDSSEFKEIYYNALRPGQPLAETFDGMLLKPEVALENYLKIQLENESKTIKQHTDSYRLKYQKSVAVVKTREFKLELYKKSCVETLYQQLINITDDNAKRSNLEEDLLKYKYQVLQTVPDEETEMKETYKNELLEMVNGMVLVGHHSLLAWTLYFDLNDFRSVGNIEVDYLVTFFHLFNGTGLANVMYAYIFSEISPFDKSTLKKIADELAKRQKIEGKKNKKCKFKNIDLVESKLEKSDINDNQLEKLDKNDNNLGNGDLEVDKNDNYLEKDNKKDENLDKNDNSLKKNNPSKKENLVNNGQQLDTILSEDEVMLLLVSGYDMSKDSLLSHRILTLYYLHLQEYESALTVSKEGIDLLIRLKKLTGFELATSKQFFIVNLAKVYTYHEPPKNFSVALKLYDSVLSFFPDNSAAMVGKALVYMQEARLSEAEDLLSAVVTEHPEDNNACLELYWCKIQRGDLLAGREGLNAAYRSIQGTNLKSYEKRATNLWRLAQSYLYEAETVDDNSALIQTAFENLMASLKLNKNHAASYTSLGMIYSTYYGDENRALKCFYKAFELDVGEITAARRLVEDFASKADWELAEIVCERLVSAEKVRRRLTTLDSDRSWPYRVLGVAALESQKLDKAVEWFQSALRLAPEDTEAWVGLGEAYLLFGRFESAIKVFGRATARNPDHWHARYLLGVSQCRIKEYAAGIATLKDVLRERPHEQCAATALAEALVSSAHNHLEGGFYGRATASCESAVDVLAGVASASVAGHKLWKALQDIVRVFLVVQSKADLFPYEKVIEILNIKKADLENDGGIVQSVTELDRITLDSVSKLRTQAELRELLCELLVVAAKCAVLALDQGSARPARAARAAHWYNLGLAELEAFSHTGRVHVRDAALVTLKKAILLESAVGSYWTALGIATVSVNPRIAQHCFIRAAALEPKNGHLWTNLAVLYLRYGDAELAQQAFLKAQSISPDLAHSWIGDALMAEAAGDLHLAGRLFAHALVLSNGRSPVAQLMYGASVSRTRGRVLDIATAQELATASFAMTRYLKQRPADVAGLQIAGDIAERLGDYRTGAIRAAELCKLLESRYETAESEEVLLQFAQAKSQLARFCLGNEEYLAAVENAQFVLDVLGDDSDGNDAAAAAKCVLSSVTIRGLAFYFVGDFEGAIAEFKRMLKLSGNASSFVILVAQALYNYGDPETKQAAMDELFESVTTNGSSLMVLFTLAAIALIENDTDVLPVVQEELQGLSLEQLTSDTFHKVPEIITHISNRLGNEANAYKHWQRNVVLFPNDYIVWKNVDAKIAANIGSSGQAKIDANQLSLLYTETRQLRFIQRSLVFNPENWKSYRMLSEVVAVVE